MPEVTVPPANPACAEALISAMRTRDPSRFAHGEEVVDLCCELGRRLGLPPGSLVELGLVARLRDVGKLGLPAALLHKPEALTQEEWWLMRRHPDIGAAMLRPLPGLDEVATLVRFHHEWWDGSGYPGRLAGEEIPLASRIVCACDAWVAMRGDRPYRSALTRFAALGELRAGAGVQFDPAVVEELLELA